jgi:hypothetical protein
MMLLTTAVVAVAAAAADWSELLDSSSDLRVVFVPSSIFPTSSLPQSKLIPPLPSPSGKLHCILGFRAHLLQAPPPAQGFDIPAM